MQRQFIDIKTWYLCHRYGIMKTTKNHLMKRGSIQIMQQLESLTKHQSVIC